jgi:hypothetical protein
MENNDNNFEEEIIDIEDTSSGSDTIIRPFNPNEIEIETPPYTVGYLIDRLSFEEINLNTEFQRENNLWSPVMQSRLIESILLGLPLPAFYFDTSNKKWDIIDGLQRCCSIDNFCVKKSFKLTGLEFLGYRDNKPFLEGKSFDELDRTLQRSIITRPITVNLVKKADKKVRFILFKRLNTGGLELTPSEIRNAVFQGIPANAIKKMAKCDSFISATEGRIPSKRMQDRDFVSRFVAFYLIGFQKYEPGLDDFINSSMELLDKTDINQLENDFNRALNLARDIFGNDAFRKRMDKNDARKPINKAYFEVITVLFSKLNNNEINSLIKNREIFKTNLITLMKTFRYSNSLSGGTGTKDSVNIRFSWFKIVLEKSILGKYIKIGDDNKIDDSEL